MCTASTELFQKREAGDILQMYTEKRAQTSDKNNFIKIHHVHSLKAKNLLLNLLDGFCYTCITV